MEDIKKELEANPKSVSYANDQFCSILIDILTTPRLVARKVRTLKSNLKDNITNSLLGEDAMFFLKNTNLKEVHSIVANEKAAKIFLSLDEGHNMRMLAQIAHDNPKKVNLKYAGKYVSYWLDKMRYLGLICRSDISKGRETIYEKNMEKYPKLIDFLKIVCEENIKTISKEKFQQSANVLLKNQFH